MHRVEGILQSVQKMKLTLQNHLILLGKLQKHIYPGITNCFIPDFMNNFVTYTAHISAVYSLKESIQHISKGEQ